MNTTITTTTVKRVTKAMRFNDIKALLEGKDVAYGTTIEDALNFCDTELALLARKNSGDKKQTEAQKANEEYKTLILNYLTTQFEGVTCTDIQKGVEALSGFQNQKIASLVTALEKEGKVVKEKGKGGRTFIKLA